MVGGGSRPCEFASPVDATTRHFPFIRGDVGTLLSNDDQVARQGRLAAHVYDVHWRELKQQQQESE